MADEYTESIEYDAPRTRVRVTRLSDGRVAVYVLLDPDVMVPSRRIPYIEASIELYADRISSFGVMYR